MLCLSDFELYSRWVPLANGIELSLLSITSRRSRLRIKKNSSCKKAVTVFFTSTLKICAEYRRVNQNNFASQSFLEFDTLLLISCFLIIT